MIISIFHRLQCKRLTNSTMDDHNQPNNEPRYPFHCIAVQMIMCGIEKLARHSEFLVQCTRSSISIYSRAALPDLPAVVSIHS
ncbi:hypothetical protein C8R48DRAFT_684050 [Suillus tomentosus]|nr:hypothetical protein C8R48DRAFT_684050 [Suillus tomentosus]